ncbi:MAG: multicopper oxidase domain-containing protein [Bryobacterales bacterium]|nr:multicopper oxidase domain-containing protein [Bryobacterales bacterium]
MPRVSRRRVLQAGSALAAMPAASQQTENAVAASDATDIGKLPRVKQELVDPPFVPKHEQTNPGGPAIVEVELVVDEGKRVIDESGTEVHTLTFNDSIPGPLIICPEGDYVELTLKNPHGNVFMHNVDFHASTGGLGGGALTKVAPGQQA